MFWPSSGSSRWLRPAQIPPASGRPVRVEFRKTVAEPSGEPAHAATFLRRRRIVLETELKADPREFARIFVHEVFHFVWLRLGNAKRRSYESLVAGEIRRRTRGELGWSAERRKRELAPRDRIQRRRRWREYCCESFCDTAAWLYSGIRRHEEFTLGARARMRRGLWFHNTGLDRGISI